MSITVTFLDPNKGFLVEDKIQCVFFLFSYGCGLIGAEVFRVFVKFGVIKNFSDSLLLSVFVSQHLEKLNIPLSLCLLLTLACNNVMPEKN